MIFFGLTASAPSTSFNCDTVAIEGKPVGRCEDKLGRPLSAQVGPQLNGRPTIAFKYEPDWGTNFFHLKVALLQKHNRGYRVLWSHDVVDSSGGLAHLGVTDRSSKWKWTYDARRKHIEVTGTRTVGNHWSALKREFYCYSAKVERFARCHSW
jgi:hypothetical protein